jgi:hypothetical protein
MAKAGVEQLARALRVELAPHEAALVGELDARGGGEQPQTA